MITVRLTRQQAITIESLLRAADEEVLVNIAEGFNEAINGSGIRPIRPMTVKQVMKLIAQLEAHE
jgi:hypothetical protein